MTFKAILVSFDNVAYTATIRPIGAFAGTVITAVPVTRHMDPAGGIMAAGRTVIVQSFDESDPRDACIVAVYTPA